MGKYPATKLLNEFSDWHWRKCSKKAYLSDIDRIWVEIRGKKPKAVFDIKRQSQDRYDPPTKSEIILADWFEDHDIPYYNVYISNGFSEFIVYRHLTRRRRIFSEEEMIHWINRGLPDWR